MSRFRQVVVVGLDGLEPAIVERMMAAGELPHLSRLREQGGYARLATTYPAQTPVAWSTFATGVNPGGHGVFDFLRRDPATYRPELGLWRHEQPNAFTPPRVVSQRRGQTIWGLLTEAGVPSVVLRCPCTYPPDAIEGRMLSGMGVPDARGSLGTATFYTSEENVQPRQGEAVIHLRPEEDGRFETYLPGPLHPKTGEPARLPISLDVDAAARRLVIRSLGEPNGLTLEEGRWSGWLKVKFKLGLMRSLRGMARFFLARCRGRLEVYASPVNFDPHSPPFAISSPAEYAGELTDSIGEFHTTGMPEEHAGLENGRLDEAQFLAQCEEVRREREAMMLHELSRRREGFFFCLFDTPDRVQHLFWRCGEQVIPEEYRACDRTVGKALEHADDETLVVVLSDHGFGDFRRGVHLNSWLLEHGLLTLRGGARPGVNTADFFRDVDWGRTKAYALGLGGIYLNLRGREAEGIVDVDDALSLAKEIANGMTGLADGREQATAVRSVSSRHEIYRGPYAKEAPDLLVNFAAGYRASWETALGGMGEGVFADNTRRWSGDHIVDPALVPGVLFMNHPFREDEAKMIDLAPTVLESLGVESGKAMEGQSLLSR